MRMKAREVREILKGRCDPAVMHILEALAEDNHVLRQQLDTMANNLDLMANLLNTMADAAICQQDVLQEIRGMDAKEDDLGPVTR